MEREVSCSGGSCSVQRGSFRERERESQHSASASRSACPWLARWLSRCGYLRRPAPLPPASGYPPILAVHEGEAHSVGGPSPLRLGGSRAKQRPTHTSRLSCGLSHPRAPGPGLRALRGYLFIIKSYRSRDHRSAKAQKQKQRSSICSNGGATGIIYACRSSSLGVQSPDAMVGTPPLSVCFSRSAFCHLHRFSVVTDFLYTSKYSDYYV